MNEPILQAQQLGKIYREGKLNTQVLEAIDLTVHAGEQVSIIGASGSGKSTLLHLLGGLERPSCGQVLLQQQILSDLSANQRARLRNQHLGFVYQFHHLLPEFSALENVAMPLLIRKETLNRARQSALVLLNQVGLSDRVNHKPAELSGGERQRVAIARALVTQPLCVLADEPTGNLDRQTAVGIQKLMQQMNQELGISFVIVTHDIALAQSMQTVYCLNDGVLEEAKSNV